MMIAGGLNFSYRDSLSYQFESGPHATEVQCHRYQATFLTLYYLSVHELEIRIFKEYST